MELTVQDKQAINNLSNTWSLTPKEGGVIVPNQKSMFDDFSSPIDKISGKALSEEIIEKNKQQATPVETPVVDVDKSKAGKILGDAIGDISKTIGNVEVADDDTQTPTDKPTKSTSKSDVVDYLLEKMEKDGFQPYSDYDEEKETLKEYLERLPKKDLHSLVESNYKNREDNLKDTYKQEVYDALPGHLKTAVKALISRDVNPREVYAALGRVEQTTALDPTQEADQLAIAHNYLQTTQFGTIQEIEEQLTEWKEQGKLEQKAKQFKPKLDRLQEEQLNAYAAQAEKAQAEREEATKWYHGNIVDTLKVGDLGNGIKLNQKDKEALYNHMVINMRPSQLNGELQDTLMQKIEEYKYTKPDFKALARMTLFATDMDAYDAMMKKQGANEATGNIVKELKTNQGSGQRGIDPAKTQAPAKRESVTESRNERRAVKQVSPFEKKW